MVLTLLYIQQYSKLVFFFSCGIDKIFCFSQTKASLGKTAVPKLSTRKKPHMSVTVVSIGLETRAGSNLAVLRIRGRQPIPPSHPLLLVYKSFQLIVGRQ